MSRWVHLQNISDFRERLRDERDPEKRRVLEELLVKEQERLRQSDEVVSH